MIERRVVPPEAAEMVVIGVDLTMGCGTGWQEGE
jgi:hypothetical protein